MDHPLDIDAKSASEDLIDGMNSFLTLFPTLSWLYPNANPPAPKTLSAQAKQLVLDLTNFINSYEQKIKGVAKISLPAYQDFSNLITGNISGFTSPLKNLSAPSNPYNGISPLEIFWIVFSLNWTFEFEYITLVPYPVFKDAQTVINNAKTLLSVYQNQQQPSTDDWVNLNAILYYVGIENYLQTGGDESSPWYLLSKQILDNATIIQNGNAGPGSKNWSTVTDSIRQLLGLVNPGDPIYLVSEDVAMERVMQY